MKLLQILGITFISIGANDLEDELRIVAAANRYEDGFLVVGVRHCDNIMLAQAKAAGRKLVKTEQGFIDNRKQFHDRKSALKIAEAAGQLNVVRPKTTPLGVLFSEDLY